MSSAAEFAIFYLPPASGSDRAKMQRVSRFCPRSAGFRHNRTVRQWKTASASSAAARPDGIAVDTEPVEFLVFGPAPHKHSGDFIEVYRYPSTARTEFGEPEAERTAHGENRIYIVPLSDPLPRRRLGRQRRQPPELFQNRGAERDRPGVRVVEVLWPEAPDEIGAEPGCQDLRRNVLSLDERDGAFWVLARQLGKV